MKVIFFLVAMTLNIFIVSQTNLNITTQEIVKIQTFLFLVFFITELVQNKALKIKKQKSILVLVVNFLRMILSIGFLFPVFLNDDPSKNTYIYNFFIIYFAYLFLEIVTKLKNQNKIKA